MFDSFTEFVSEMAEELSAFKEIISAAGLIVIDICALVIICFCANVTGFSSFFMQNYYKECS